MNLLPTDPFTQKEIDAVIELWNEKRRDRDFRVAPCYDCRYGDCKLAHAKFRGTIMVRCNRCVDGKCRGNWIKTIDVRGRDRVVVCMGFADQLPRRRQESKEPGEVLPIKAVVPKPVEIQVIPVQNVLKVSSDEVKMDLKRPRPPEIPCHYIVPTPANKKALIALLNDPDFKGHVKIPEPPLLESLKRLSTEEVSRLMPDINKTPAVNQFYTTWIDDLAKKNSELEAQLAALSKK